MFLDAFGAVGSLVALHQRIEGEEPWPDRGPMTWMTHSRSVLFKGHDNRGFNGLLLPLNDKVQWTSRDVGGGEPPPSPRSEHFTVPFNR